jgi:hypothetical protein
MVQRVRAVVAAIAMLVCLPALALAQGGNIAGTVRDSQGGVLPGVTVEVTSPQLIEKVRSTVTDGNGRYQIVNLPVGVYKVTFRMEQFSTIEHSNVELTSDFTAPINAEMKIGQASETVTVTGGAAQFVDVQNARQRQVFSGEELRELPITRNLNSLLNLVPGIAITSANATTSAPTICGGGMADAGGGFNTSGALSGCSPILESFNSHTSANDTNGLNQGRMQVDGLGIQSFGGGGRSNYIADLSNAQEVTFTLSGSLGESETGGTTINVIPRTGGNRYSGNFFTAYSSGRFFGRNDETRNSTFANRLESEYDANGAYGGPVLRDRIWFYAAARRQERENLLQTSYRNKNEGIWGANFEYDPARPMGNDELYQNASVRLTLQATPRNKFNIFWDQQYTCESPCNGVSGSPTSPEAERSPISHPLRLFQGTWTNPLTSRFLLDAAVSSYSSNRDETAHRLETNYRSIPRVVENGVSVSRPLNGSATVTTGSLNNALHWKIANIQSRASASYVTGSHNVKLGYQGQILARESMPEFNDLRLQYRYETPAADCTATAPAFGSVGANVGAQWCGLRPDGVTRNYDGLPVTEALGARLPREIQPAVPFSVTQYIPAQTDEKGWFTSVYLQDQWTLNRFTISGALRYDNSQSSFGETCTGPDLYTDQQYCLNGPDQGGGKGVNFHDITPRWGVAWDVFGNGKTAVKYSMGKYLEGSHINIGSIAVAPNAANRTLNSYTRVWRDLDGDRVVDCDLQLPATAPSAGQFLPTNGECGPEVNNSSLNARRFGRSPSALDGEGIPIGLTTIYCGQNEPSMSQLIRTYCDNYFAAGGTSLMEGWGKRRYEWQLSLGVQHEILPRLSGEVTYNRRQYYNQTVSDELGEGCDLYASTGTPVDPQQCMEDLRNFRSQYYDFYAIQAPLDPRLPGGGGYLVPGFATVKQTGNTNAQGNPTYVQPPAGSVTAVTIAPDGSNIDYWSGVDTNFVLRARGGLRLSGGTSTGRRVADTCALLVNDPPNVQLDEGRERGCDRVRPFQTNVRGTATYTIPWADVLVSTAFSYRPGVQKFANYTVSNSDVVWLTDRPFPSAISGSVNNRVTQNLLSNDTYGEGIRIWDLKLAKNIRFGGRRLNLGVDVFNVFNSDAAFGYCGTFPNPEEQIAGCGTIAAGTLQPYGTITNITTPRYARFQLQFDF